MKKKLIAMAAVIVIIAVASIGTNAKNDIVRIHILANDNTPEAQAIKLEVRDEINEYLAPLLSSCKKKSDAVEILEESLPQLQQIAQQTAGCSAEVTLGQEEFPQKTYNETVYPAGEYTALIIKLGDGAGQNWWCVAFPPMCYTSCDEDVVEYKSLLIIFLERIGIL